MARLPRMSTTQKRLLQVIAAGIVALVAFIGTIGQPEERHEEIVRDTCEHPALEALAEFGGLTDEGELCSHGPDPIDAFGRLRAKVPPTSVNLFYRQSQLCPGNGTSGERVHLFYGSPSDRPAPTKAFVSKVKQTLGLAERQLRESHPTHAQKINFYCATGRTPTLQQLTFPPVGSDGSFTFTDMTRTLAPLAPEPGSYMAMVSGLKHSDYPYCGEGTVRQGLGPERHFALIAPSCLAPNDTFLHELGHNLGAVQPGAPNDSGAYHCHEIWDVMCYDDGGSYFAQGGQMTQTCGPIDFDAADGHTYRLNVIDCANDDYWNPAGELGWMNTSDSALLTKPRRK